uniref:Kinase n=1 Tax=Rhabditophanes sp. KR3021 TaxID=114890 RepID=A0AC35TIK9_9BILA
MTTLLKPYTAKCCGKARVSVIGPDASDNRLKQLLIINSDICLSCHSSTAKLQKGEKMSFWIDREGKVEAVGEATNSWASQCQSKVVKKLAETRTEKQFIFLEDIVSIYRKPCVIDLKMGTRQYGDTATAEKKLSQTQKSESSTSGSLGVRIVGMQVFDTEKESYSSVNKYEGRELSEMGFCEKLRLFFSRAGNKRCKVLLDKLTGLHNSLLQANGFRFFSSSILMAFEGDSNGDTDVVSLSMIDFAHSTFNGFMEEDIVYGGVDEGYIHGVEHLSDILRSIYHGPNSYELLLEKYKFYDNHKYVNRLLSEQEMLVASEDDDDDDDHQISYQKEVPKDKVAA